MSMVDEFNSRECQEINIPKEISVNTTEDNKYAPEFEGTAKTPPKKERSSLAKMLLSSVTGVSVLATAISIGQPAQAEPEPEPEPEPAYVLYLEAGNNVQMIDDTTLRLGDGELENTVWAVKTSDRIDVSDGVTVEFKMYQSSKEDFNDESGADGLAVSFAPKYDLYNGQIGGSLGYEGLFGVEFDLHYNPVGETPDGEDYAPDHIAIIGDSVWKAYEHTDSMNLCDANWHDVKIDYKNSVFTISYDDTILSSEIENTADELYIAISGASGGGSVYQLIKDIKINGSELPIGNDD